MKLRRRSEEEEAWRDVAALWDASLAELKAKVDRTLKPELHDERDDDGPRG